MPSPENSCEWFEDWFDSPYYHLLYSHRDDREAERFIAALVKKLGLKESARVLDLACGRGRHALYLHRLGMDVTGIDLSPRSIAFARKHETQGLSFYEHDMRRPFRVNYFDAVLNLFTSFGYFETERDNMRVLQAVHKALKPDGLLLIDFFNGEKVERELRQPMEREVTVDGVQFHTHKRIAGGKVIKEIRVREGECENIFTERVQLLREEDFRRLLEPHFKILHLSGNYALEPFDSKTSDRLIVTARKN